MRSTVDQLMLVANHEFKDFEGDLDDYERWLFDFRKQTEKENRAQAAKPTVSRKEQRQLDAEQRELRKPLVLKVKKLEQELDNLQKEAAKIEVKLADESLYEEENKVKLQEILAAQTSLTQKLKDKESEWLAASDELEKHALS